MTIHDFDMARFFLGDVVEVFATAANRIEPYIADAGDVDSVMVTLKSSNGTLCTIVNSRRRARLRPAHRGLRVPRDAAGGQPDRHLRRGVDGGRSGTDRSGPGLLP